MKRLLLIVASVVVIASAADATEKPDFSGNWKMNAAKSSYGPIPPPAEFIRKIAHTEPAFVVVEDQSQNGGNTNTIRKMSTDGKVAENNINGAPVNCSATWEGTTLTVKTVVDTAGALFEDNMSLSPDGKVLTSKVRFEFPQGSGEITVVFDRL